MTISLLVLFFAAGRGRGKSRECRPSIGGVTITFDGEPVKVSLGEAPLRPAYPLTPGEGTNT